MPRAGKRPQDRQRRANSAGEARTKRVKIRLSPLEYFRISTAAKNHGVSIPRFYEECALSEDAQAGARAGELIHKTMRIGVDFALGFSAPINDIARHANTYGVVRDDFDEVLGRVDVLLGGVDEEVAFVREELIALSSKVPSP